jgi:hypothetical protein
MQPRSNILGGRTLISLGFIGLLVIGGLNYEGLMDYYALSTYRLSAKLTGFESRISLSSSARATLYRSNPAFDDKATFNVDCDTRPHELELGCYYRGRIYVLQIDNASLASEMDVVSAHELLHAQWDKTSAGDRASLSNELERVYGLVADSDLRNRMASYAKSEPGEQANELHSILGTEYANLSPVLEAHYAKLFQNRSQIVSAHNSYQAVFESRRVELETELSKIRADKARLSLINHQLDGYRTGGQIQAYNALVPQQNKLVDQINANIGSYQVAVDEYNALSKSLDSQAITDTEPLAK